LGEGSFGQVFACVMKRLKQSDGKIIKRAVKMIKKTGREIRDKAKFEQETHALTKIAHPNILTMYEMYEDDQ
jgi:serine/threonine protein kinase